MFYVETIKIEKRRHSRHINSREFYALPFLCLNESLSEVISLHVLFTHSKVRNPSTQTNVSVLEVDNNEFSQ